LLFNCDFITSLLIQFYNLTVRQPKNDPI